MQTIVGYLQYYLGFFGDKKHSHVDLLPVHEESAQPHRALEEKFTVGDVQKAVEEMDKYTHPCWCNPELIYADDIRGNEVWLHKPVQ